MDTMFRLDASIRPQQSVTRSLADRVEAAAVANHAGLRVIRRDVGLQPLPTDAWPQSFSAVYVPEADRSAEQRQAAAFASVLADELLSAAAYLFAIPLYNWGAPAQVKNWVDLITTDPRFGPRSKALTGRPAALIVARGGDYGADSPRASWDHATPWLTRIFTDVWGLDLSVIETDLTLASVVEEMAERRGEAARRLAQAELAASALGATLLPARQEQPAQPLLATVS
ncbi:MAG: NAD(P)H-dependent oxidoreductase [Thermomicrobiales bacterium]